MRLATRIVDFLKFQANQYHYSQYAHSVLIYPLQHCESPYSRSYTSYAASKSLGANEPKAKEEAQIISLNAALLKYKKRVASLAGLKQKGIQLNKIPSKSLIHVYNPVQGAVLRRRLLVFNYREANGRRRVPTLAIYSGKLPVIYFNKQEFESLVDKLPWLKTELELFRRKL